MKIVRITISSAGDPVLVRDVPEPGEGEVGRNITAMFDQLKKEGRSADFNDYDISVTRVDTAPERPGGFRN